MKKILLSGLSMIMLLVALQTPQSVQAQAVEEGDIIVEGFYGWPNFATFLLRAAYGFSANDEQVNISSAGPLGGRVEYMIDDNISLGLEGYYGASGLEWEGMSLTDQGNDTTYMYDVSYNRVTANLRAAYHFDLGDNFDAYVAGGVGYRYTRSRFDTDDPFFEEASVGSFLPFSIRGAVGGRYFIANTIGLGLEFALGGPLVSGGVSIKL